MKGFALGLAVSLAAISAPTSGETPRSAGIFVDPNGKFRSLSLMTYRSGTARSIRQGGRRIARLIFRG